MSVVRFDVGQFRKPQRLANGWLRVDAALTKAGVFEYRDGAGSTRRELRLPDEVFAPAALESFAMVPVTVEHPGLLLDASNTREHAVGWVGEQIRSDGQYVIAGMLVTDAAAIADIEAGKRREVSCGYVCELEGTPGEYQGERYDAIQRSIRGNHVALTVKGRAGPDVRLRMDAAQMVPPAGNPGGNAGGNENDREAPVAIKYRLDGVEYDMSEQAAQALGKVERAHADSVKALETELAAARKQTEQLTARADALAEQLKTKDGELAKAPERIRAEIAARMGLEAKARGVLGPETKLDSMSDKDMKLAVLAKLVPDFKPDGKSDDYVSARFDIAIEQKATQDSSLARARAAVSGSGSGTHQDGPANIAEARAKMIESNRNAWRPKSA